MKITRSALKSLIKEEMNRIGEAGDRVAGEAQVGTYALEGMSVDDVEDAFNAVVQGSGDNKGLEIEGLAALKRAHRSVRHQRQTDGEPMIAVGVSVGHHNPESAADSTYSDNTDRTAWAQARLNNKITEISIPELESAVAEFNAQNDGKGGQVKQGMQDQFQFMSSDNVTPFPLGGPTVWL